MGPDLGEERAGRRLDVHFHAAAAEERVGFPAEAAGPRTAMDQVPSLFSTRGTHPSPPPGAAGPEETVTPVRPRSLADGGLTTGGATDDYARGMPLFLLCAERASADGSLRTFPNEPFLEFA